ncbi:MAG: TonB-dependent receptor [Cytophagales bacterium]|nr:TonB-dependent receptor [Cytophagales bacterium]
MISCPRSYLPLAISFIYFCSLSSLFGQIGCVSGLLRDSDGKGVQGAHVGLNEAQTVSDSKGRFILCTDSGTYHSLHVSHVMYVEHFENIYISAGDTVFVEIRVEEAVWFLEGLRVWSVQEPVEWFRLGTAELDAVQIESVPTSDDDIGQIVSLLPGVTGGMGLSNKYSVRGGSFEENLVYIEGIPIYTPYLVSSGQQEGLGAINRNFLKKITFSAGGWPPRYGNRLSSLLNVEYKYPQEKLGKAQINLLGTNTHLEGSNDSGRVQYMIGQRYKNTRLILNTNPISGQYQPNFFDLQTLIRYSPRGSEYGKISSEYVFLGSYARNQYLFFPRSQKTKFGTFSQTLSFVADFEGRFALAHDIYQSGIKASYDHVNGMYWNVISSYAFSREREHLDLKNEYRLCDVILDPTQSQADLCRSEIGTGKNFSYERNHLRAFSNFNEVQWSTPFVSRNRIEVGLNILQDYVDSHIAEYQYADSADYTTILSKIQQHHELRRHIWGGYVQDSFHSSDSLKWLIGGFRWGHSTLVSPETWISPRVHFSFRPDLGSPFTYRVSLGFYHQPPFYREMRAIDGNLSTGLRSQQAFHVLAGGDYRFVSWGRDFVLFAEAYYKHLSRLIPYEQRESLVQYYSSNTSHGYAYGLDLRLHGAFIPGEESWFSLSLLSTSEDIANDGFGYIRRPTDQRFTLGFFFQDYLPFLPFWGVHLKALYGTGLPFSPVGEIHHRNYFNPPEYYRLDVGISRELGFLKSLSYVEKVVLLLEVLNTLETPQVLYHSWVRTHMGQQFAVPNVYDARFVNFKARVDFRYGRQ